MQQSRFRGIVLCVLTDKAVQRDRMSEYDVWYDLEN